VVLDTVIAAHADVALGDISRQLVREWVADLSVDLAPASVHKSVGVLRQVLAMAVRENRLVVNPVDGVELPPVTAAEQRFLTLEQLRALADAAGAHRPLVYVLGTCGFRFGEVAELRWRDVDLAARRLRIARSVTLVDGLFEIGSPKSGKGRTVSLPAFVADLLAPGEPDALVFPDSEGGHMRGTNVRRRWWSQAVAAAELFPRTIVDAAGGQSTLYDFKLHDLRHTAITTAVRFFERPLDEKNVHGSADHNYGYRPFGIEYSVSPDRPDMNECFTLWSSRLDLVPEADGIAELTDSFLDWRDSLAPLVKAVEEIRGPAAV